MIDLANHKDNLSAPEAGRAERLALRVLQLGAIAIVLVVSTLPAFELDRFFVPKELALHLTAVLAGLLALRSISRSTFSWVDLLLLVCLALSVLSAAMATNRWMAMRALAISASGIVIFWIARGLRGVGLARRLLGALAFAVVLAAVTSLLQTYGVETTLFSENRAPGGTLGNRNFVAHIAAFGFPSALVLGLVFFGIAAGGIRQLFVARDVEEGLFATALLGTAAGAILTGLFDAVLLLAVPTLLVGAILGVLWTPGGSRPVRKLMVIAVIIVAALGAVRSAMQLVAMDIYATRGDRASLVRAAQIDPGSYRLHLRLARIGGRAQRCRHARAAHTLFPHAQAAIEVSRACE